MKTVFIASIRGNSPLVKERELVAKGDKTTVTRRKHGYGSGVTETANERVFDDKESAEKSAIEFVVELLEKKIAEIKSSPALFSEAPSVSDSKTEEETVENSDE